MSAHPAGPRHGDLVAHGAPTPPPDDLSYLAAQVWSAGVRREADGQIAIHGIPVSELSARHGTPLFVFDEPDFRARARRYAETFEQADVYYASKAFSCVELLRWVDNEGLSLDVASAGELAVAELARFPMSKVLFHGNNKSSRELERALRVGVGRYVLDSLEEIERLADAATTAGQVARVLVRVTVGVEAHTHEFIATAHEDQKFGFSFVSGAAAEAVAAVLRHSSLKLVGIHSHIGSQIFDTSGFEVAAHRSVEFAAMVADRFSITIDELNLGGGFGIAYVEADDPGDVLDIAKSLRQIVERECATYRMDVPRLAVEPGRALVGPAMFTLYEVGTVKPVELDAGERTYVSVDGGMSDNPRTSLYEADYTVSLANRVSSSPPMLSRVVGKHCESGDVVVRDAWLPSDLRVGDLLAVPATGAYCRSMASNYNLMGRPPVVAVREDGSDHTLVRRETIEDLLRLDAGT